MKSVIMFFSALLVASTTFAATIELSVGVITQKNADEEMSRVLGVPVKLFSSRTSYNPGVMLVDAFTDYESKVINILVNNVHQAKCDLVYNETEGHVFVVSCESSTAIVDFNEYLDLKGLGINLPKFGKEN